MSHRRHGTPKVSNQGRRMGLRAQGYNDGLADRQPRSDDPEYKASYRRGQQRRADLGKEGD